MAAAPPPTLLFSGDLQKKRGLHSSDPKSSVQPPTFLFRLSADLQFDTKNRDNSTNRPGPQDMALKPGRMASLFLCALQIALSSASYYSRER